MVQASFDNKQIFYNANLVQYFECNSHHKISIEIIDNYFDLEGKELTNLH